MGRKIFKKELDESEIKLKQEETSRSVNQLKIIGQNLENDNTRFSDEIYTKKQQIEDLDKKIAELVIDRHLSEQKYFEGQEKLNQLNGDINQLNSNIKIKEFDLISLQKQFDEKLKLLEDKNKREEESLRNIINNLSLEKNFLQLNKQELEDKINNLNDKIINLEKEQLKKQDTIENQDSKLTTIYKDIELNENILIDSNFKKEFLLSDIKSLTENKQELVIDIDKKKQELNQITIELNQITIELESTKELNLKLIKREDVLRQRESYINEYYKKAGLSIN